MVQIISANKIEEIDQLIDRFGLQKQLDPSFFAEWQQDLPTLTDPEQQALTEMQEEYEYLSRYANLEAIVKMVIVGPLLKLAGFYRQPFRVKAEKRIELITEDEGTIVRGQLDVLVMHDRLWAILIEAKRVQYSLDAGIPQALFYMLADPDPGKPMFGLVTNGPDFQFLKLVRGKPPVYGESVRFYMNRDRDMQQVLQILKKLAQWVQQ